MSNTTRRSFLKTAGSTAGVLMAGLPSGWMGSVYAQDGPETPNVRFGMMFKLVPERATFLDYAARIAKRPAAQRAEAKDKALQAG